MREILFRAKRMDNGGWVEGYYFCMTHTDGRHVHHFIIPLGADLSKGTAIEKIQVEIDPETLCQYTGLKDKDGNRIWEHDFLSVNTYDYEEPANDYFGEVIYMDSWMCWCIQSDDDEYPIHLCECEGSYKTEIYVIGNSIDNPELLEVKK